MFEKISRAAETVATKVSVSRRGFLGRLGQTALGAAGVLGGLLALSNKARAGSHDLYLCYYQNAGGRKCSSPYTTCGNGVQICGGCPKTYPNTSNCCKLVSSSIIGTC